MLIGRFSLVKAELIFGPYGGGPAIYIHRSPTHERALQGLTLRKREKVHLFNAFHHSLFCL